jgi:replicative DNA helicase
MNNDKEFRFAEHWDKEKKERFLMKLLQEVPPEVSRAARKKRSQRVAIQDYVPEAKEIRDKVGQVQGLSTGFKGTDDMTLGMTAGELIVVSGPPSAGKTQLATCWAYYNAKNHHKVLFVTMEMTKPQMTERFMGAADTDLEELDHGIIEYQKEDELASVDINYLVADAVKDGTELVVIDHLQYFSDDSDENEARQLGRICKDFKLAAVRYKVPIILIVHITKLKDGKKPTGNDLRGSSLIRQHADQLILVYRDERPNASKDEANTVEVTNWKNRLRGLRAGARKATFYADGAKLLETKPASADDNRVGFNFHEPREKDDVLDLDAFEIEDPFASESENTNPPLEDPPHLQDNVAPHV